MSLQFLFVAGHVALDFVNTVARPLGKPYYNERFTSAQRVVDWAVAAKILGEKQAQFVWSHEDDRRAFLRDALCLRESLFDILLAHSKAINSFDLSELNRILRAARGNSQLTFVDSGFRMMWTGAETPHRILWTVAERAADLLMSSQLRYVKLCASEKCQWPFLDTSKNHTRRWCDMSVCGNRAKAHRFVQRRMSAATEVLSQN